MQNNQVSEVICLSYFSQVLQHIPTSVDSDGVRNNELELFLELNQFLTRIPRSCDEDFRVSVLGLLVLIIDVSPRDYRLIISQLQVMLKLPLLLPELIGHPLLCLDGPLYLYELLLMVSVLQLLVLVEQVLLAESYIFPQHI